MRGRGDRPEGLFSYVRLDERIPADHPLRAIRALADEALGSLNRRFEGLYSPMGRPERRTTRVTRAIQRNRRTSASQATRRALPYPKDAAPGSKPSRKSGRLSTTTRRLQSAPAASGARHERQNTRASLRRHPLIAALSAVYPLCTALPTKLDALKPCRCSPRTYVPVLLSPKVGQIIYSHRRN